MTESSIWQPRGAAATPLPSIVGLEEGGCAIYAPGAEHPLHVEASYSVAHRWAMNRFRLTSTQMLPVYAAYAAAWEARHPPEEPPEPAPVEIRPAVNKYRKAGA